MLALAVIGPVMELLMIFYALTLWWVNRAKKSFFDVTGPCYALVNSYSYNHFGNICSFALSPKFFWHVYQVASVKLRFARHKREWTGGAENMFPQEKLDENSRLCLSFPQFSCSLDVPEDLPNIDDDADDDKEEDYMVNPGFKFVATMQDRMEMLNYVFFMARDLSFSMITFRPLLVWKDPLSQGLFFCTCPHLHVYQSFFSDNLVSGAPIVLNDAHSRRVWKACKAALLNARIVLYKGQWEREQKEGELVVQEAIKGFAEHGFVEVDGLFRFNPLMWGALQSYYRRVWLFKQTHNRQDGRVDELYHVWWREPIANHITNQFTGLMRKIVGKDNLCPERPVSLWYPPGSIIAIHVDEYPPFAYSLSITVDMVGKGDPSLHAVTRGAGVPYVKAVAKIGKALVFEGRQTPHFRERIPDEMFVISLSMAWDEDPHETHPLASFNKTRWTK